MTVLDDPATARYTHTLTVTERLGGLYQCNVSNNKPSSDIMTTTVIGIINSIILHSIIIILLYRGFLLFFFSAATPPSGVCVLYKNATSLNVSWTPSTDMDSVTGYMIYYDGDDGSSGNVSVPGGSTDRYLLTGLQTGVSYSVSILTLSTHLPSQLVSEVKIIEGIRNSNVQESSSYNILSHQTTGTTPAVSVTTPSVSISPTADQDDRSTSDKAIPEKIVAPIVVICVLIAIIAVSAGVIITTLRLYLFFDS